MTNETKLNIAFEVRRVREETGFTYVAGMDASVYAKSLSVAKAKLKPMVEQEIRQALEQVANYSQAVIGCVDGTVLVCQFRNRHWGYEIGGPGRQNMSTVMGYATFAECCEYAMRHAESSYSGIGWQQGVPSETRERIAA
jgi:hypothetical protein